MDRFLVRLPKKRRTGHDSDPTEAQNGLHQEEDKFMRKKIVKVDSSSSVKESSQPRQSYLEFGSHVRDMYLSYHSYMSVEAVRETDDVSVMWHVLYRGQ